MIVAILVPIVIGALLYHLGNTPDAQAMQERIEKGRDKHRKLANDLGIRL